MVVGRGRPESSFDAEEVFGAAAAFDKAVEINCRPERLDPPKRLLRQVVDDGRTGRLVPVRDIDALADAIGALATDAGLRRSLGEAARVKARREFDQQRVIDTTLAVYEGLLARRALVA